MKPHWNAVTRDRAYFSYHRCPVCGVLYCPEFFMEAELTQFYASMPDNTLGVAPDVLKKTQRGYFDVLKRFSSRRGGYLEVGPDLGFFTAYAVQENTYNHFWLFEPKTEVQSALKTILAGRAFDIIPSMLAVDKIPPQTLSAVVMVHVLDHLLEPRKILEQLKSRLLPGATLLFVTHDESSWLARAMGRRWDG